LIKDSKEKVQKETIEYTIIGKKLTYTVEIMPVVRNDEVAYLQISAREETLRKNYEELLKKNKEVVECTECNLTDEVDKEQLIQERDEALELLIENAERLQIIFDGSNDGFWDWNIEKDDLFHSKQYYEILGYRYGELKSDLKPGKREFMRTTSILFWKSFMLIWKEK
jgi:PAS domain-containing protein